MSEKIKRTLLYAMIFITAGIVLVIEPLSHILGFRHSHSEQVHESTPAAHPHSPGVVENHPH